MNNPNQPTNYDAVLGGQAPPPINGVVLGGIEGVEKRLATGIAEYQTAALDDALHYGDAGLKVIIKSLQYTTGQVKLLAYSHLRARSETWVKEALKAYNKYEFLQCIHTFGKQKNELCQVNSVTLSPDNQLIYATKSLHYADLNKPQSWNLQAKKQADFLKLNYTREINCVVISPDGKRIINPSSDGYISVWNLETGELIKNFKAHYHPVHTVVINPDGQSFISTDGSEFIKIWDLHSCQEIGVLTLRGQRHSSYALCFNKSGKLLISGSDDQKIRVWDLRAKREIWTLQGHTHPINSLAINADGILVSGSDQRIKVWDTHLAQEIFSFYGHADWVRSIVFSPDGQRFITAGDITIKVWDVATGKKLNSFQAHDDVIRSLALSYDGATLVSGSDDGRVKIWRC